MECTYCKWVPTKGSRSLFHHLKHAKENGGKDAHSKAHIERLRFSAGE